MLIRQKITEALRRSARREGDGMDSKDIEDWRRKIDELDRQIVALISERASAAQAIGKLKRTGTLPVYEPNRERVIFENVRAANKGPLPDIELTHIYERIIDVMRALQREELASKGSTPAAGN
jgi:chorismate mutase